MTLPYSPSRAVYEGNGAATAFPFAFKVWSTEQLSVSLTSPEGHTAPAQGWAASLGESGGTVTYLHQGAPLPAGWRLAIVRDMPFAQGIDLVSASRFDPQVIEDGLDQATAELQQLSEKIARAVILPATSDQSPEEVVASIYASRDAAAASANAASAQATAAQTSAEAAASSAATAAQTVQTAAAGAVSSATAQADAAAASATAAAQSAAQAEGASSGLAPRVDAVELKNNQQDTLLEAMESSVTAIATTLIGSIQTMLCADSYVPNGCVAADGGEYTRAQFPTLYDTYLVGGRLLTCSYEQQAAQVGLTGNCGKFALDASAQKFKVPLLKDGDSITQAASAAEIGKSVKAGLPNITGTVGKIWNAETAAGAFYRGSYESNLTAAGGSTQYGAVYLDASRVSSVYRNDVTTVLDEQIRLRHFVVVASAQNNASMFDLSNYIAALAGKANSDLGNIDLNKANIVLQRVVYEANTMTSTTSVIPCDDTIPQITEGSGYMAVYITPKMANSKIEIDVTMYVTCYNATSHMVAAVFKDSEPNAIASAVVTNGGVGFFVPLRIKKTIQIFDTNQHTIQVRVGVPNASYPISINGTSSRILGGALTSSLVVTEYAA